MTAPLPMGENKICNYSRLEVLQPSIQECYHASLGHLLMDYL
jgi:hypothetical protein